MITKDPQHTIDFYRGVLRAAHDWHERGRPDHAAKVVELGLDGEWPCRECSYRSEQQNLFEE